MEISAVNRNLQPLNVSLMTPAKPTVQNREKTMKSYPTWIGGRLRL
jgi:hypothetical protein